MRVFCHQSPFQWAFPKHIDLFHELWALEDSNFTFGGQSLKLGDVARDAYGFYALGHGYTPICAAAPRPPIPDAAPPGQRQPREFRARSMPANNDVPADMADVHPADRPLMHAVDRENARVPPVTLRRFKALVEDEDFSLRSMDQFRVHPPVHPAKMLPFSAEAWEDMAIDFWSPSDFFHELGVDDIPCANCGLEHARFVRVIENNSWRSPRRVKTPFGEDIALAGRQCVCYECRRAKNRWKTLLAAAESVGVTTEAERANVAALRARVN